MNENIAQDVEGEVLLDLEHSFDHGSSWVSRGQVRRGKNI